MIGKRPLLPDAKIPVERGKPSWVSVTNYRPPKKGEYYLSGAQPALYLAKNDMDIPYWVCVPLVSEFAHSHVFQWVTLRCPACGSENIDLMAVARWNVEAQQHALVGVVGPGSCNSCGEDFVAPEENVNNITREK